MFKLQPHKGVLLIIGSSICVCIGQLLWKLSYTHGLTYMIIGFGLYGMGALLMLYAYKFGKLSDLQPILSLNYVLTIVFARLILNEEISVIKFIGIMVIIFGVILIAKDEK